MQHIDFQLAFLSRLPSEAAALVLVLGIWYAIAIFSAWYCLRNFSGVDRLTWLVAILGLPLFGVIFFWFESSADENKRVLKSIDDL